MSTCLAIAKRGRRQILSPGPGPGPLGPRAICLFFTPQSPMTSTLFFALSKLMRNS